MEQAQRSPRSRRAARDLWLAVALTGSVGLVVSLVVGGTTAHIEQADPPTAGMAALDVPALDGGGISVEVRPALPRAISVTPAPDVAGLPSASLAALLAGPPAGRASAESPGPRPAPVAAAALVASGPVVATATPVVAELPAAPSPAPAPSPAAAAAEPAAMVAPEPARVAAPARRGAARGAAADRDRSESARHARLARIVSAPAKGEAEMAAQQQAKADDAAANARQDEKAAKHETKAERKDAKAERKAAKHAG